MSTQHRITIVNEQKTIEIDNKLRSLLRRAVRATLQIEGWEDPVEMTLLLVETAAIQDMNLDYRGIDRPTDVLSFATQDEVSLDDATYEFALPDDLTHRPLGDIVIAAPVAQAQANALGHSLERELAFLTVHGLLHLLGYEHLYDDENENEADLEINDLGLEEMVVIQEQVLSSLGLAVSQEKE